MKKSNNINIAYDLDDWNNIGIKIPIMVDFSTGKNTHILLSGMSGSGKSYCELSLIAKLVKDDPETEIYFGDYKGDEAFGFLHECDRYYFYKETTEALNIVYEKLHKRMSGEDKTRNHNIGLGRICLKYPFFTI